MALDPVSRNIILFSEGETWGWDGSTWAQLQPRSSPGIRHDVLLAFDPTRGRLLLFGGGGRPNEQFYDTWQWDGSTWTKVAVQDAPFSGAGGGLVYDSLSRRMMLVGFPGGRSEDRKVWFLNQEGWVAQAYKNQAVPLGDFTLTADKSGRLLLFGGSTGAVPAQGLGVVNGMWTWDGTDWAGIPAATKPPARWRAAAATDGRTGELVLFGGEGDDQYQNHYAFDDTWIWNGSTWMPRTPLKAIAQVQAVFVVAVITAKDPPADVVFELQLTKPDGAQVTTRLCAPTKTNPCSSGTLYLWIFPPKTSGQATYRVLYGQGSASTELTHGSVDLLHSKTYYLEYKG